MYTDETPEKAKIREENLRIAVNEALFIALEDFYNFETDQHVLGGLSLGIVAEKLMRKMDEFGLSVQIKPERMRELMTRF